MTAGIGIILSCTIIAGLGAVYTAFLWLVTTSESPLHRWLRRRELDRRIAEDMSGIDHEYARLMADLSR
jgi:uncharacterized protein (DUF58 family)